MSLSIIDTHVHIWDFTKADYPWLTNDTTILNRTYAIEELEPERKQAGISAGVLVQAANNDAETNWMLQVAKNTDWIAGVVGWLPLQQPDVAAKQLQERMANSYFKGVRHLIHNEANDRWLLQPSVLESLSLLAASNIPFDVVGIHSRHLQAAIQVATKLPDLRLMLNHLNQPPFSHPAQWQEWCTLMKTAAGLPNVFAKISGLGTTAGKGMNWNADDIMPALEFVLEHFGLHRCCSGGDWPVSLLAGNYTHTWEQYKLALTSLLKKDSAEKVFFTTAKAFYKL